MSADVISLRNVEPVRVSVLRMGAAGQALQAGLATWFDLLHKRSPEDRAACPLSLPEIVSNRSVVFARDERGTAADPIFVGNRLTRTHREIAAETVRGVSLATPIAFTHQWGRGNVVNSLVLPFGSPHRVVVMLFDW